MKQTEFATFMEDVTSIDADFPSMGGASGAILGSSNTGKTVAQDLQNHALAFADEYTKDSPDHALLEKSAKNLEGSIMALNLVGAITEARLEELVTTLHELVKERP